MLYFFSYQSSGTVWTAVAHIVTGVIGSGVLSLPWSIAQLGWLAGPSSILLIASSTLFSAFLLCNTYRSPHPETGPHRSASYLDVVNFNLGNVIFSFQLFTPFSIFSSIPLLLLQYHTIHICFFFFLLLQRYSFFIPDRLRHTCKLCVFDRKKKQ